ncbi:hypothetical protein, partial [Aeromonas salmonicida]|uniref:hypothetical protein n=1 Tax=Aeromonas salmonicida TaxID=645 RepID=UPI003D31AA76
GNTTRAIVTDLASQNQRVDTVAAAIEQMSVSTRDVAGDITEGARGAPPAGGQTWPFYTSDAAGDHQGA